VGSIPITRSSSAIRERAMSPGTAIRFVLLGAAIAMAGCSGDKQAKTAATSAAASATAPVTAAAANPDYDAPLPPLAHDSQLSDEVRAKLNEVFKGDLDEMVKRRLVRVGVTYNRTFYFVDKGQQRGITYEYIKLMEDELNKRHKTGNLKVAFWPIPLPRNQLLPALVDGKVDMVVAQLTVTPERLKLVDFSNPTRDDVSEVVVGGQGAPPIASVNDLSGQEVLVRKSSSYYQSLLALNQRLQAAGKPPVILDAAPESLEDDDLLEMANAGLVKIIIVDNYLATFWKQVFTNITVHDDVAVRTGGHLAVAIRKNSPQIAKGLNAIVRTFGKGSAFGNTLEKRYLQNTAYITDAESAAERKKFQDLAQLFRKYGDQYSMDYLLMAAQGYQESRLDQKVKSPVGAVGVMQVMPATGKELGVGDIHQTEANINAGVKYMRFVIDTYYKDEPMTRLDKGLFAFASYNAGPGRIRQLRAEAQKRGLDPNVWFGNVEQIASERIGRETVTYVSNIYKYYIAYRLLVEERDRRNAAKEQLKATTAAPAK
jgi:membrane-bound lytic murein transglycosylase MltF